MDCTVYVCECVCARARVVVCVCARVVVCVCACGCGSRVVLCLLTSLLELPCHAGLVKVGIGSPERETEEQAEARIGD